MRTKHPGKVALELPVPAGIRSEVTDIHSDRRALAHHERGEPFGKPCGAGAYLSYIVDPRLPRDLIGPIGCPAVVVPERDAKVKAEDIPERGVERGRKPRLIHELEKERHSLIFGRARLRLTAQRS